MDRSGNLHMNQFRRQLTCLCIIIAVLSGQGWSQQGAVDATATRLAQRLAASALTILSIKPITPQTLETAAGIFGAASELAPEDVELWRLTLNVADLAEDIELQRKAIRAIVELDPEDDVVRLRRLLEVVESAQTVEQRVAVYDRLLAPQRIDELGKAVASRLALDYALLLRREGRVTAFGEKLALAVSLDTSNRAAASLAAGFFRSNVNDPYGETELLINLFMADPTTIDVQAAIAQLALGSGAYDAAARMFLLMSNCYIAQGDVPSTDIVADHVIALWGAGQVDKAMQLIEQRQQAFNAVAQARALQEESNKTPLDVTEVSGLLSPTLSTVRAAVLERERDPHALEALRLALQSYDKVLEAARNAEKPPAADEFAAGYLEMAWLAAWLGRDAERAEDLMHQAESLAPMSESARAKFDGWLALRRGDFALAADHFARTDPDDHAALIGRALVLQQQNQMGGAARLLLRVAREQPGTIMGVWSANVLFATIEKRVAISETARKIQSLVDSVPTYIDRFPVNPGELFSVRVHADRTTVGPGDPIILNIELSNNSRIPLGIDPEGPIQPQIALLPTLRIAQQSKLPPMDPIIIDIDQQLRLEPKQRIIIPIDLRHYDVGSVMESFVLLGSFVRVKAVWNFRIVTGNSLQPGLLGGETETLNFRVNGVRVTLPWIEQAMRDIEIVDRPGDVDTLIMLTHLPNHFLPDVSKEALQPISEKLPAALASAFDTLDPLRQALVLSEMSPGPVATDLLRSAQSSEHQVVQIAYLLSTLQLGNDPMLLAGLRSDDPLVRKIAEQMQLLAKRREAAQRQQATPAGQ